MELVIIGESKAGGRGLDEAFGPRCASAKRLAALLGMTPEEMQKRYRYRYNLLGPGPWDAAKATAVAGALLGMFAAHRNVAWVLCGRKVADAFGYRGVYLSCFTLEDKAAVVIPHPSGRNRLWSDGRTVRKARNVLGLLKDWKGNWDGGRGEDGSADSV